METDNHSGQLSQFKKWHNYKQGNEMYDKELLLEECVHSIIKQSLIEKLANRLYFIINKYYHGNMPIITKLVGIKAQLYSVKKFENVSKKVTKRICTKKKTSRDMNRFVEF